MFLDIDGNKVFALSFGTGPRTILAHSGWIGNFEDWIATLAHLSENWRTVVYDHRGAGETVVPVERISHEALVDDVFRVMDAMKIERCVMAGFSRGVVTALRAVLRRPERFDGLLLMNGSGEVALPGEAPAPRTAPSNWPGATFADRLEWFANKCVPEPDNGHIRRWAVNILSRSTPEVADRIFTMQAAEPIDWAERLPRLTLPTLLIHGELDAFCRTEVMQYLHSLIPGSRLVVMESSGHLPAMTRPLDVAREIDGFFANRTS
jgi:pimeloyl-ACP methyl ester carboxylesterase